MADGGGNVVIRELLSRDLDRRIEEIIKVDQADEASVFAEIEEYVVTDRIRDHYRQLLQAVADSASQPDEAVGVWVSGFFGSGKSSFAKYLGYILSNRSVLGQPVAELFKAKFQDERLSALMDFIHQRVPMDAVLFDVSVDRAVRDPSERLAEVLYRVLLRELDYAEDFELAELEIELEREGRLPAFLQWCERLYGDWRRIRKGAQGLARASAVLHHLDPRTYPSPDSWAQTLGDRRFALSVGKLVDRTFDLLARRRPGKTLLFVVDEVGQYVSRSVDKIEDLRALVEEFGKEGKNRVRRREAVAPVWLVVTAQEKLEEVVAAIDSKRVELARLQDRFRHRVDLSPADIREVATRRVLQKRPEGAAALRRLYEAHRGQLGAACRLERGLGLALAAAGGQGPGAAGGRPRPAAHARQRGGIAPGHGRLTASPPGGAAGARAAGGCPVRSPRRGRLQAADTAGEALGGRTPRAPRAEAGRTAAAPPRAVAGAAAKSATAAVPI
jgi:hypothetical protein